MIIYGTQKFTNKNYRSWFYGRWVGPLKHVPQGYHLYDYFLFFRLEESAPSELDVEETEIAANYAAITAYNGPLRLSSIAATFIEQSLELLSCFCE